MQLTPIELIRHGKSVSCGINQEFTVSLAVVLANNCFYWIKEPDSFLESGFFMPSGRVKLGAGCWNNVGTGKGESL